VCLFSPKKVARCATGSWDTTGPSEVTAATGLLTDGLSGRVNPTCSGLSGGTYNLYEYRVQSNCTKVLAMHGEVHTEDHTKECAGAEIERCREAWWRISCSGGERVLAKTVGEVAIGWGWWRFGVDTQSERCG